MKLQRRFAALLFALLACASAGARAATAPLLDERLARLSRLGTIAYVTAHPDDESAAIITYLARGLHARVVILSLTRGEGGQNVEGPELDEELAAVRTRELQRAAAGYGAEVRFIGAQDFGYSKSLEETLERWNEDSIVAELARQIRALRPLAVISHWSGTERDGGNAHHRAAGLLARRAFALAGEPQAIPEQILRGYQPWQPRYFLVRTYNPDEGQPFAVPAQDASPVPGKTYEELGWEAFQSHRSQGLHRVKLSDLSFLRGYYLRVEATLRDGPPAPASVAELAPDLAALPDLFPSVPLPADWRTSLAQTVELAEKARGFLKEGKADEAALALVQGAGLLAALRREVRAEPADLEAHSVRVLLDDRQSEFLQAAAALAGVRLEALTDRAVFTPGEDVWVGLALRVGEPAVFRRAGFELKRLQLVAPEDWTVDPVPEASTVPTPSAEYVAHIPHRADPQQAPFPALRALAVLSTGSLRLELSAPVRGLARARAERFSLVEQLERLDPRRLFRRQEEEEAEPAELEPVSLAPPVTLELSPQLRLLRASPGETTHDLWARAEGHRPDRGKTSVWLDVPSGWYTPMPQGTELDPASPATLRFTLRLPGRVQPGSYELEGAAVQGERTFKLARQPRLKGIRDSGYTYKPARARVEVLDIKTPLGLRIGYIGFNDDPVPALLGQLGVGVDMLDEGALAEVKLQNYDAVLIAPRAYDYRKDLADQNSRLLDYVRTGGTLVVELQGRRWDPARYAPYAATKKAERNLRVTDAEAEVRVLVPEHPVLNFPNRIGADDWKGWVQERGLYFWESWSDRYTPLVEMADPGEDPLQGALLYAPYGDGVYIYCGLALFRQVRAGVPGGVRLYLNLLSQTRAPREPEEPAPGWNEED